MVFHTREHASGVLADSDGDGENLKSGEEDEMQPEHSDRVARLIDAALHLVSQALHTLHTLRTLRTFMSGQTYTINS